MEGRFRMDLKLGCKSKIKPSAAEEVKKRRAASRADAFGRGRKICMNENGSPGSPSTPADQPRAAPPPAIARRQQLEKWKKDKEEKERHQKANQKPIFKLRTVIDYPIYTTVLSEASTQYVGATTRTRSGTSTKPVPPNKSIVPQSRLKSKLPKTKIIPEDKKFVAPKSVKPLPLTVPQSPAGMSRRKNPGMTAHTLANMPSQLLRHKFIQVNGRSVFSALASAPSPNRSVTFKVPQMLPGTFKPIAAEPLCIASPNITVARGKYQDRKRLSVAKNIYDAPVLSDVEIAVVEEKVSAAAAVINSISPEKNVSKVDGKISITINATVPSTTEANVAEVVKKIDVASSTLSSASSFPVNGGKLENQKDAIFYRNQLDEEIVRLNKHCEKWSALKNTLEASMSEEVQGILDSAIGHTQLLIRSKFEQFRGLTVQCEAGTSVPPILVTDLEGFWEMLQIQVENLDKEFENLENLMSNGWQIKQTAKVLPRKIAFARKPTAGHTKPVKSSGIKALMLANKKKLMAEKALDKKFNDSANSSNICISDPRLMEIKETPERSSKRMSLLQGVLSSSIARKTEHNSPIVMRVSQSAKMIGTPAVLDTTSQTATATNDATTVTANSVVCSQPATEAIDAVQAPAEVGDMLFVKPFVENSLGYGARPKRLSVSEGKVRKPRATKRLTILQQLQRESKQFNTKKTDCTVESEKENETFVPSTLKSPSIFSPRRSMRLTPYNSRGSESAGRPSLLPVAVWLSPKPLESGELISFETPPAVRRSTRVHRN